MICNPPPVGAGGAAVVATWQKKEILAFAMPVKAVKTGCCVCVGMGDMEHYQPASKVGKGVLVNDKRRSSIVDDPLLSDQQHATVGKGSGYARLRRQ